MPHKSKKDRALYAKKWRENHTYEGGYAAYLRNWHANHPGKQKIYDGRIDRNKRNVRKKLGRAVKSGKIIKLNCKQCGNINTQAHHEDYSKPLEVIWLCKNCHMEHHRKHLT